MEKIDDIKAYLKEHENKQLLRFITCGNVDVQMLKLLDSLGVKPSRQDGDVGDNEEM